MYATLIPPHAATAHEAVEAAIKAGASERKLRLYVAAHWMEFVRRGNEDNESHAEALASSCVRAWDMLEGEWAPDYEDRRWLVFNPDAAHAAAQTASSLYGRKWNLPDLAHLAILRDLFEVLEPPPFVPPLARAVAEEAYKKKDFSSLPILADMLEDVGASQALLDHLRGGGPHFVGCSALDCLLGKS